MSDLCDDHKARACRRCAESPLAAALAIVREGADTQHTSSLTWQESQALLDALSDASQHEREWEAVANRYAAKFEAEYERAEGEKAAREEAERQRRAIAEDMLRVGKHAGDMEARAVKAEQERDEARQEAEAASASRVNLANRVTQLQNVIADQNGIHDALSDDLRRCAADRDQLQADLELADSIADSASEHAELWKARAVAAERDAEEWTAVGADAERRVGVMAERADAAEARVAALEAERAALHARIGALTVKWRVVHMPIGMSSHADAASLAKRTCADELDALIEKGADRG